MVPKPNAHRIPINENGMVNPVLTSGVGTPLLTTAASTSPVITAFPTLTEGISLQESVALITPTAGETPGSSKTITVVHCWTAPRSRSTALLYSFEARGAHNTVAIDEPLKRAWLIDNDERVFRPYKHAMIAGIAPPDRPNEEQALWERELLTLTERIQMAAKQLVDADSNSNNNNGNEKDEGLLIFCKHMSKTHYLYDFENEVTAPGVVLVHKHMFLIRDPTDILRSWDVLSSVHQESCEVEDVGIVPLLSVYKKILARDGSAANLVMVLDSDELSLDPEASLRQACHKIGVPFLPTMLQWSAGPHECDSRHAPWWYGNAHQSTGWLINNNNSKKGSVTHQKAKKPLNPKLLPALQESFPAYEYLAQL